MSWANFAQLMNIASMGLKVAGEATNNKYLIAAAGATAGAGTAASGAATMETLHSGATTANTTTPSGTPVQPGKHPVAPPPPVKPDPTPQTQQSKELLKVNPGGYTKPGLQE